MLLVDCDIQEFVKDHIKLFLTKTPLTFAELKSFLVSKAPIPHVQNQCVDYLVAKKTKDLELLKHKLFEQAFKKQQNEDDALRKRLNQEESEDKASTIVLKRNCKTIRTQIETYECDIQALQLKLIQQMTKAAIRSTNMDKTDEKTSAIELINNSLIKFRTKIKQQEVLLKTKEGELHLIEVRESKREQLREQMSQRDMNRAAYNASGLGGLDTLSTNHQLKLNKTLAEQEALLEHQHEDYIKQAEFINFSLFMELLPEHLHNLKLSYAEKEALRLSLKLMEKHLQAQKELSVIEDGLQLKTKSISSQVLKLKTCHDRQHVFKNKKPHLEEHNLQLNKKNKELKIDLEHHLTLRKQLSSAALFLLMLTFLLSIPVILTYSGVIPLFLGPLFTYLLVSSLPVLGLLTCIALGIATWVYHSKARGDVTEIELNTTTIKTNTLELKKNAESLNGLNKTTVPGIEKQIKRDESLRDAQTAVLQSQRKLAEELLKQAKDIEPRSYAQSQLLTPENDSADYVDVPDEKTAAL